MTLFFSDLHLGTGTSAEDERRLIQTIEGYMPELEALYLVGDVYDEFIEYRNLVPKGFVRFQGLLAALSDAGVRITYLEGNHDPWHRDYYRKEFGIAIYPDSLVHQLYGRQVFLRHGDGVDPGSRTYNVLKPILRHRIPVGIYRALIPGDYGFRLARWYNRKFGHNEINECTVKALRNYALSYLEDHPGSIVIMGHSHVPEHIQTTAGEYVNLGAWCLNDSYAVMDAAGIRLINSDIREPEPALAGSI